MIQTKTLFLYLAFLTVVLTNVNEINGQRRAPGIFIDQKICPGEGCSYAGHAKVVSETVAFRRPSTSSGRLFELPLGTMVSGLDSQVHTVGGRFVVRRTHERYRPGDVIRVYTYLGEGIFKVWYRGRMTEQQLEFSPWGGSSGTKCQDDERNCWGRLSNELDMKWWLKVMTNSGQTGWILVKENLYWLEDGLSSLAVRVPARMR